MKQNAFILITIAGMILTGFLPAEASEKIAPEDLMELRKQRSELKLDFREKELKLEAMDSREQKYLEELKALDNEAAIVNQKIRDLYRAIELSGDVIEELEANIIQLGARIENRDRIIKERLRSLQAQEGLKLYVHMMLDTKSISQFFDMAAAVMTIMNADSELLEKHKVDMQNAIIQEEELKQRMAALKDDQAEMEALKAELQEKADEKQRLLDSIKEEKQETESELMDLYEVYVNLASQEIAILKERQQSRLEYLHANPEDVFIMPASGELTSGFGLRWGKHHAGIDIADPSPDAKVIAAASGTVIRSYYSASYGNCVIITHKIKKKTFTTLYAHLEKSIVTTGQTIKQGEMLGYMGNTGDSKGKHLHFEIHAGQWNYEKTNSIDPIKYLTH